MGQIFGKTGVAEPAYEVLYHRSSDFTYEIRKYGTRFAAHTLYNANETNSDDNPFRLLAQYIGVFGTPQNDGGKPISMTAPVIIQDTDNTKTTKPTPIAMTAPVVIQQESDGGKYMEFILPAEYDTIDKVPKPTNPAVTIRQLPPAVGAVHRYSGRMGDDTTKEMAIKLVEQLQTDGIDITTEYMLQNYQFWGFTPPFTLPMFRRNEVWCPLDENVVEQWLVQNMAVPKN